MGAPTSAIIAETFIQHLEYTIIYQILNKHQIIDYNRNVEAYAMNNTRILKTP
jgi:hypothetical protein